MPLPKNLAWTLAGALGLSAFGLSVVLTAPPNAAQAASPAAPLVAEGDPKVGDLAPVETDMHEFMEYINQPAYKRLKAVMAQPEKDGKAWLGVKSDSLILAEVGNLVQLRGPEGDDRDDWIAHAEQVRQAGSKLYRAGHDKDNDAAQQHYRTMLQHCNACHTQFAGGEHMLKP